MIVTVAGRSKILLNYPEAVLETGNGIVGLDRILLAWPAQVRCISRTESPDGIVYHVIKRSIRNLKIAGAIQTGKIKHHHQILPRYDLARTNIIIDGKTLEKLVVALLVLNAVEMRQHAECQ